MMMREKLARTLCDDAGCVWDFDDTPARREWFRAATAVLKAMREPTPGMVDAITGPVVQFTTSVPIAAEQVLDSLRIIGIWQAMIDAALAEGNDG